MRILRNRRPARSAACSRFFGHGGPHEGVRLESVDPGGLVADSLPIGRVIASVVYPAAEIERPGVIRHIEGNRSARCASSGRPPSRSPNTRTGIAPFRSRRRRPASALTRRSATRSGTPWQRRGNRLCGRPGARRLRAVGRDHRPAKRCTLFSGRGFVEAGRCARRNEAGSEGTGRNGTAREERPARRKAPSCLAQRPIIVGGAVKSGLTAPPCGTPARRLAGHESGSGAFGQHLIELRRSLSHANVVTPGDFEREFAAGARSVDQRDYGSMTASRARRDKAALSSGCEPHPATAPAGSNRSSHGGDKMAEAFGVAGHV